MSATVDETTGNEGGAAATPLGLYRKLAEVMAEVENVGKDGRNDFHKYDYATAEAVLRALRKPLMTRNVVVIPSLIGIDEREFTTPKGKPSVLTTARIKFTFVDGDTGETCVCEWAGAGDDPADKGLYKAYTGAVRTFLRTTFLLPQGEDPEADSDTDRRAATRTTNGTGRANGVSADPPAATEPVASANQRGLLNAKAGEAGLAPADFAVVLLSAAGAPARGFDSDEAAKAFVDRNLQRLPARLVDPVLAGIAAGAQDAAAETVPADDLPPF